MTDETLIRHINRALHHLYDPVELAINPLAELLGIQRGDIPTALPKVLLDGIAALKPGPRVSPDSNTWHIYHVLCYRFEEQSSQEDVATQMAVSPRQVRRLEYSAIRALANHLSAQYRLSPQSQPEPPAPPAFENAKEFDFLRKSYPRETTNINTLVDYAIRTFAGMLKESSADIHLQLPGGLPPVRGQSTTLRQVLLNLFLAAIHSCSQATILVKASADPEMVWIEVSASQNSEAAQIRAKKQPPHDVSEFVILAKRLAELSAGTVDLLSNLPDHTLTMRLGLPIAEQIPILFVDDNEDSLRLFERFLDGTRFLFFSTRDPREVLTLAEEVGCQIIVLDIMLPDIDGWELLGRIRAHPHLGEIPTIISTILPHETLANSLGAAGFLRKPVTREALLSKLNFLAGSAVTGLIINTPETNE
jgi:CheY-like chemotaxis protein